MSTWLYEARRAANPAPEESEDSDAAVGNDADDDEQSTQVMNSPPRNLEINTAKKV